MQPNDRQLQRQILHLLPPIVWSIYANRIIISSIHSQPHVVAGAGAYPSLQFFYYLFIYLFTYEKNKLCQEGPFYRCDFFLI